jgi:hypothetical protein
VHKLPAVTREHLPSLKGRPIAACHSWVTNALSVNLADVLNTVCYQQFPQVLPDTGAFARAHPRLSGMLGWSHLKWNPCTLALTMLVLCKPVPKWRTPRAARAA